MEFSLDDTILEMSDDDPNLMVKLYPDRFAKLLKNLDPNKWDPLPCNFE